jgi:rubrerythrin
MSDNTDRKRMGELIAALNQALQAELRAVKMYYEHAALIDDLEVTRGLHAISEVEEGHARALRDCIAALGSQATPVEPVTVPARHEATTDPGQAAALLYRDLAEECWAIKHYAATIANFVGDADDDILDLLEENLLDEMRHARWLRDQIRRLNAAD